MVITGAVLNDQTKTAYRQEDAILISLLSNPRSYTDSVTPSHALPGPVGI